MLVLETIAKIRRLYHADGLGFKTIARLLKISKNTVKRIIREDQVQPSTIRKTVSHRVLEPYVETLQARLKEDETASKKYRRSAKKLFLELQQEGYSGSYDTVHHFISALKKEKNRLLKAYVPLMFEPGEAFQFDWSQEEIILDGQQKTLKVAHIRLCYSRFFLVIAYPNEELSMVMDAHAKAFEFFGGQPRKGIYDNMKTVVKKILLGKDRLFNSRFLELCSYYCFEPVACTPAAGWEKGQVENQVNFARKNFFTPQLKAESLELLNDFLLQNCLALAKNTVHPEVKDQTVFKMYEAEKPLLTAYPGFFAAYQVYSSVVSPYCLVQHATNRYSVECSHVHQAVKLHVYANRIEVFDQDKKIAEHIRCFEKHQTRYNPWHYVPLLERKPGAFRNGAPFKILNFPPAIEKIKQRLSSYADYDKQWIKILLAISKHGLEVLALACQQALEEGISNPERIFYYLNHPATTKPENDTREICTAYNQVYLVHRSQESHHAS